MISIDDQIKKMKEIYPQFEVNFSTNWFVIWEGFLSPFMAKKYKIRITMCHPKFLENVEIEAYVPRVEIIYPKINLRAPHLYKNETRPDIPLLCLYDPAQGEWNFDEYVASTTVPWTKRWLASYEGWRATGKWTGGGRDHEINEVREKECKKLNEMKKDQQEHFNKSVYNFLGQKIGTYASFPLMVAGSKGYFQPLSWHDWKINSLMVNQSEITSTTSAALQLAA